MSLSGMQKVLVVGGGVSGAAFALHLVRDFPELQVVIDIIEPRRLLGAGLAYTTDDAEYRMNGPADCMSPLPDDPLHFDTWFRERGELSRDPSAIVEGGRIVARRAVFGQYMDALVRGQAATSKHARLVHVRRSAVYAKVRDRGFFIALNDGTTRDCDVLVLGIGHPPAGIPPPLAHLPKRDALICDPWDDEALGRIAEDARVLLIGTGLTACDVIASLAARRHRGNIIAVSRRGLFPLSRRVQKLQPFGNFSDPPATTARELFWRVRTAARAHQAAGGRWEDVILSLREQAPVIWGALLREERLRFLRHLRSLWDSHRYPMAPQISAVIEGLERSGRLQVFGASILSVRSAGQGYFVEMRRRGHRETRAERVDVIVNCTGPGHRSLIETNPLLRSLAEAGLVRADPYQLGLLTDERSRTIGAGMRTNQSIFALGPLTRGTFGEVIGFPQITLQPRQVAADVASLLKAGSVEKQLTE